MDTASVRRMMGLWLLITELFHLGSELTDGEGWAGLMDALEFTMTHDHGPKKQNLSLYLSYISHTQAFTIFNPSLYPSHIGP